jgi:signal transduction histidine kinase
MDLLTNLMEWSRSQTGRMVFNPININLAELIEETSALLQESANHKHIIIAKDLPPGLTMFADKSMVNTILRNLISNAIKYTYSGGRIDISAVRGEKELVISVSDNGIGLNEDTIEKLFLIEASTSTRGTSDEEGTGLGLILCKEFISKHGGKIWVESETGQGSRFTFTIPV